MRTIILRAVPATLVFFTGIASLIYGSKYHTLAITSEQEIEVDVMPPPMFGPQGDPTMDGEFPGPPGFGRPDVMGPPAFATKVKEKVIVTDQESEPTLIREVSVGGVMLLASGALKRTYTGDPPSLCPT